MPIESAEIPGPVSDLGDVSHLEGKETTPKDPADRISDAARELFGNFGYDGVSVRDIARRAEVTIGSISYYFGSKELLYRDAARNLVQAYVTEAREILDAGGGLREIFVHAQQWMGRNPLLIKFWCHLQTAREPALRSFAREEVTGPLWEVVEESLRRDARQDLEGRMAALARVSHLFLDVMLEDAQLEQIFGLPAAEARTAFREHSLSGVRSRPR